jgi:O-antigen/teichoic acid export membrane protein
MRTAALVAYRAASDVAGKAAFFAVTIIAARRLTSEGFGVFAIGTAIGWLAVVASDFGLQMHLARAVAGAPEAAGYEFRRWLRLRVAFAVAAFLVVALAVVAIGSRMAAAILLFTLGYLTAGVVEFVHHFYRGLSRTDIESTLTLWHRGGTLAVAGVALWLRPEPATLAAALLVPPIATAVYTLRVASRLGRISDTSRPTAGGPSLAEFVRDVAPIGAGVLISALYFRIDLFLLEMWQGTETVGRYNAVFRIVEALRLFPAALLAVMLPRLVRAPSARPLARMASLLTAFGIALAAALWFGARPLVETLYGPAFAGSVPAFRILAAAFPLMALNYALTHQLIAWNGHRAYAALCLAALFFNVALNARLIPTLSLAGAAWTTLATEALLTAGCLAVLARATARRRPATAAAMVTT